MINEIIKHKAIDFNGICIRHGRSFANAALLRYFILKTNLSLLRNEVFCSDTHPLLKKLTVVIILTVFFWVYFL